MPIGLTYIDNNRLESAITVDLTYYWSNTALNTCEFIVDGTDVRVKMCGDFNEAVQAHIVPNSDTILVTDSDLHTFAINKKTLQTQTFSWWFNKVIYIEEFLIYLGYGAVIFFRDLNYEIDTWGNVLFLDVSKNKKSLMFIDEENENIEWKIENIQSAKKNWRMS